MDFAERNALDPGSTPQECANVLGPDKVDEKSLRHRKPRPRQLRAAGDPGPTASVGQFFVAPAGCIAQNPSGPIPNGWLVRL